MSYETNLIDYINMIERSANLRPLNLGGVTSTEGGDGGPPGGFMGYLPQTRVAYDLSEDATMDVPTSGESLLDNLNHIRYRIETVETTISGGISGGHTIENEGFPLTQRTNLNFVGLGVIVTDDSGTDSTIVSIYGGIEDAPIDGSTYGRKDGNWIEVSISGIGIEEAPIDGLVYGRKDGDWIEVTISGGTGDYLPLIGGTLQPEVDGQTLIIKNVLGRTLFDYDTDYQEIDMVGGIFLENDATDGYPWFDMVSYGNVPSYWLERINGTKISKSAVLSGEVLGRFTWTGYDGSGYVGHDVAKIEVVSDDNFDHASNAHGGHMDIYATPSTGSSTKALTINSGSVNIPTGSTYNINGVPHAHVGGAAPVIYYESLDYDYASPSDTEEHVIAASSPLLITLPIIEAVCVIKLTIQTIWEPYNATGNYISGEIGANSDGLYNTTYLRNYTAIGGKQGYTSSCIVELDLSTQQYASAVSCNESGNSINYVAGVGNTAIIVEIYG